MNLKTEQGPAHTRSRQLSEGKMSRFDYVKYDQRAVNLQKTFKDQLETTEQALGMLPEGRYKSLALTALEEAYAWIGKAIRDEQIKRNGSAPLQEGRVTS